MPDWLQIILVMACLLYTSMVDDLGLSFESMAFVRSSLRKFVNQQLQPGDLVAICRTGAGSGALQQFTVDKRVLLSVIDGLRYNFNGRFGLSYFDPYEKYSGMAERLGGVPSSGALGSLDVSYEVERKATSTVGTLGAVNYIVGALREMPGRKSIVLFSDGMQLFESTCGSLRGSEWLESYADITVALRRLIDRANRSGTVIYTMQATGLQTLQPDAQDLSLIHIYLSAFICAHRWPKWGSEQLFQLFSQIGGQARVFAAGRNGEVEAMARHARREDEIALAGGIGDVGDVYKRQ